MFIRTLKKLINYLKFYVYNFFYTKKLNGLRGYFKNPS